ncbi:MAG: hypothetical protein LBR70_02610 [Lactobacillaceae bacterium]|jgi:GH24 family phage-related lysozyme (muramidase)|nr:hypothetical protein [Lactobacillaceae bacterium]
MNDKTTIQYNKIKSNRENYRSKSARSGKTFRRVAKLGLKTAVVLTLLGTVTTFKTDIFKKIEQESYIPSPQWEKYRKYEDTTFAGLALVEGFSNSPYICGAGYWTIGYGNRNINGEEVNSSTVHIDRTFGRDFLAQADTTKPYNKNYTEAMYKRGKEYVVAHLDKEIYPLLDEHVKVPLNEYEHAAVVMFIYNIGSKAFINSEFLKGLNNGEKGLDLAKKMTGFRAIIKKDLFGDEEKQLATGLLKREWVMINMFLNPNIETVDTNGRKVVRSFMSYLPEMIPEKFYKEKDMSFYYHEEMRSVKEDEYYTPKLDNKTLSKFVEKNTHPKNNVGSIIDSKTRESIMKKGTLDISQLLWQQNYR